VLDESPAKGLVRCETEWGGGGGGKGETLVVTKIGGRDERARGLWEGRVREGRERLEGLGRDGRLRWVLGAEACEWVLGMRGLFTGPGGGGDAGDAGAGVKRSADEAGIQGGPRRGWGSVSEEACARGGACGY
jgi:hypothetical protein